MLNQSWQLHVSNNHGADQAFQVLSLRLLGSHAQLGFQVIHADANRLQLLLKFLQQIRLVEKSPTYTMGFIWFYELVV